MASRRQFHDRNRGEREPCAARTIGNLSFDEGEGDYMDYRGLVKVVMALYHDMIARQITISTVDRNPVTIEADLRTYIQYCCLYKAISNKAFSHIMIPRFAFVDPKTGHKVDNPDEGFMTAEY